MVAEQRPPVPAVPSVVLGLGNSLQHKLAWLEQRFRGEIGSLYPGNLLRFRLVTRPEQLAPDALHALCDPLLAHPLWLSLQDRGLAPGGERGPRLCVYAVLSQEDPRGCELLAPLHDHLPALYGGHPTPDLCLFFVGTDPHSLPSLAGAGRPVPCFVLGPVKRFGYRTSGRQEPFEAIRLSLNALLASTAAGEIEGLLRPDQAAGLRFVALGASAIAVARPQMETWLRNTLLQRLAEACLQAEETAEQILSLQQEARGAVSELFGLEKAEGWRDAPDELWEKEVGRRVAGLFVVWANEILQAWGVEVNETRRGHWRIVAAAEGDLYRHLQQILSELSELQEEAQGALTQDIVQLAGALRRHFERRGQAVLSRWAGLPARLLATGPRCLPRLRAVAAVAEAALARAGDSLQMQRGQPLWLRGGRDSITLARIVTAQMAPVRSAAERARLSFVPPGRVALRLLPLLLLLTAAGADLRPGWAGMALGLGAGLLFSGLAVAMQFRRLRRETYFSVRELCRLYEGVIGGLVLSEAQVVLWHLQEAVAASAAQLQAVEAELSALEGETRRALEKSIRVPRQSTYLERHLSDPAHCARVAARASIEGLLAGAADERGNADPLSPAAFLAAAMRGDLPAAALGPGLIDAVGRAVGQRGSGAVETRVEEMLVAGAGGPFSAEGTMDGLHRRALPLWPGGDAGGPEVALVVMSREAAVAFQGWLAAHRSQLRLLPTLQRDRISYLRCRPLPAVTEAPCTG